MTRKGVIIFGVIDPAGTDLNAGIAMDVVCGLPNQPDLGMLLVWAPNGRLVESTISPWKMWTLTPNPCAAP